MAVILKIFNVMHGDAMLFRPDCVFKNVPLLIDTGAKKYNIYKKISNEQFDIMITHSDNDHMGGLADFLNNKSKECQNIYLPLYLPEIYTIFSKLMNIGSANRLNIQNAQNIITMFQQKVIFVYDGWHTSKRKNCTCNLAQCSHSRILNPPLNNFDLFNDDPNFVIFTFQDALKHIYEKQNIFDNFDPENYTPENFNDQDKDLINARMQYFQYVIRLIGYMIFKNKWHKGSANELFRLTSNDVSIVLHYEMKDRFSILFTGDAGDKILENLINQKKLSQTDILKVPHHGGANSVGRNILSTLCPKYTILSHGSQQFSHGSVPNKASLNLLLQLKGNQILATNTVRNVIVTPSINQVLGKISINGNNDELEFI